MDKKLPYVFVVGCPRSGTTLLQRMLDHHPLLAVSNDSHFIPKTVDKFGTAVHDQLNSDIVEFVRLYRRFPRLGLTDEAVYSAAEQATTYPEFVCHLYRAFAKQQGKPYSGEKTPDYVKRIPLLHDLFPEARFIHIVRDGRDVALSTLDWAHETKGPGRLALWHDHPVAVCALWWMHQTSTGIRDGKMLGDSFYCQIRYENLVAEPVASMKMLCQFLDFPYSQDTVEFHQGKTRGNTKLSAKKRWLPPTSGLRNWSQSLVGDDLLLFEAIAGAHLNDLGYSSSGLIPTESVLKTAEYCCHWWENEMHRRQLKRTKTK